MVIDNNRSMENKCNSQANQILDMQREKVALSVIYTPKLQVAIIRSPGAEIGGGGTKGGGGENGGDPGQGCPVTGPHRPWLLAKLQIGK